MNLVYTIIIPTYNCASYLHDALESIDNQTYDHSKIQVLVIDDGSIDNTKSIVTSFQQKRTLNIEYIYKKNGNWGSVINYVKKNNLAKGSYITILDADDTLYKNALTTVNDSHETRDLIIADFHKTAGKSKFQIHVYPKYVKYPKGKLNSQTPFCVPLAKFLSNSLFYSLPELKENVPYQDALYTAHAINNAQSIKHLNKPLGSYNYKRPGNSMSLPWSGIRYKTEVEICLELLNLDAQELVAIHVMRNKFRKLLKESMFQFTIKRKFSFKFFPLSVRWIMWLIYITTLKYYFKLDSKN